jgi:hypothetical protein
VTQDPGDLEAATGYRPDFPYHDENLLMLDWYAGRLERTLRERRARRLLSLGIGHQVVSQRLSSLLGGVVESYTIVEGSQARIDELAASGALAAGVSVVRGYFEEFRPPQPLDAVEMARARAREDPALVLKRYAGFSPRAASSPSRSGTRARCIGWSGSEPACSRTSTARASTTSHSATDATGPRAARRTGAAPACASRAARAS